MAQQLFATEFGFRVYDEAENAVDVLISAGAPGGDASYQDSAGVGSLCLDRNNGDAYIKTSAGTGADKWAAQSSKLTASWREPVRVVDTTTFADIAAAQTELNDTATPGSIGGVDSDQFSDGDRILFTDLTTGTENVYIVTGTPGSGATLVEDANDASDGDVVRVNEGTGASSEYAYDGSAWLNVGGTTSDELGFLRAFIGKDAAGSETPDYGAGLDYIGQTDDLETAITKLAQGLALARKVTSATGVTTQAAIDTMLVDDIDVARWIVHAKDDAGAVRVIEVLATHNGTSAADATATDYTVYSKLRVGNISGFDVDVDVNGTGAAQTMRLLVESTDSVNVKAVRVAV